MWRLGVVPARACGRAAQEGENVIEAVRKLFSSSRALQESAQHDTAVPPPASSCKRTATRAPPLIDSPAHDVVTEGRAKIMLYGNDVFYNKVQVVNRDLSIAVLRSFVAKHREELLNKKQRRKSDSQDYGIDSVNGKHCQPCPKSDNGVNSEHTRASFRVLEALAASGLRAIRYALEVEGIDSVVALDNDKVAVESCEHNIKLNGDSALLKVQPELGDARVYMLNHEKEFDVVDVDPYGSPSIFLDSAVQCAKDGGLLMCTATDTQVLCGTHGEVCYSKYGSYSLKGKHCHEMAVRILLSSIESHANRYKRHIVPVLSISVDFYVRVFVRIYTSPLSVKQTPTKLSYVYHCHGCESFHLQPVGRAREKNKGVFSCMPGIAPSVLPSCKECDRHWEVGGPIWSNPIHDPAWVSSIHADITRSKECFPAFDKIHGLLTAVMEELPDVPLYVEPQALSGTLKCISPSHDLFSNALGNAGYRVSGCHASPSGLKTDAPMDVVWDIMRCWVKLYPIKPQPNQTIGSIILNKEPELQANFARVHAAHRKAWMKRFPPNPEKYWGPKARAGRRVKVPVDKAPNSKKERFTDEDSNNESRGALDDDGHYRMAKLP